MRTFIDEKAPKTHEYVRYIFASLLEQAPLTEGANVEIAVIENKTPFPKLVEMPEGSPDTKRMSAELSNWAVRHPGRFGLLYEYTNELLSSMCTPLIPVLQPELRINMLFNYVIADPKRIYREAEKFGLKVPELKEAVAQDMTAPSVFTENPSEVHWRGAIVAIPPNSKQFCVCCVMFSKAPGETVSWDEIAEKIDGDKYVTNKSSWRSVYDAISLINQKIHAVCGEKLFESTRQSFRRRA